MQSIQTNEVTSLEIPKSLLIGRPIAEEVDVRIDSTLNYQVSGSGRRYITVNIERFSSIQLDLNDAVLLGLRLLARGRILLEGNYVFKRLAGGHSQA